MSKVNKGRRQFLKNSGQTGALALSGPALQMLIQGLVNGVVQDANAAAAGSQIKNYVHLQFPGGPPRWMYDLFLTPWEADRTRRIVNGSVATRLNGGSTANSTTYSLTASNTQNGRIYLPYLWRYDVPTSKGDISMKRLLGNMAHIRGIDMEINSHGLNRIRQHRPVPGEPSIGGRIADHTKKLIHGMRIGHGQQFVSEKKYTATQGVIGRSDQNSLALTLRDFQAYRHRHVGKLHDNHRGAMEKALGMLNQAANVDPKTAEIIAKNRVNAELILRRGFNNIDEFWNERYPAYAAIIRKVISQSKSGALAGFTDKPIVANSANPNWSAHFGVTNVAHSDHRNVFDNQTYIRHMAESFTIIEYLLKEGLTAFTSASMHPFYNLKRTASARFNGIHDLHRGGTLLVTYIMSLYYRAFSGCLIELIEELKATQSKDATGTIFDNTLINVTAEFNRSARDDGTGSDHGITAHSVALYSGILKGPHVIGNIKRGATSGQYKGTWGEAAPTEMKNGQKDIIRIGHVGETIITLLGLPGLSVNAYTLIDAKGNPLTKKARLV